jgi:hypothetical protein
VYVTAERRAGRPAHPVVLPLLLGDVVHAAAPWPNQPTCAPRVRRPFRPIPINLYSYHIIVYASIASEILFPISLSSSPTAG